MSTLKHFFEPFTAPVFGLSDLASGALALSDAMACGLATRPLSKPIGILGGARFVVPGLIVSN